MSGLEISLQSGLGVVVNKEKMRSNDELMRLSEMMMQVNTI